MIFERRVRLPRRIRSVFSNPFFAQPIFFSICILNNSTKQLLVHMVTQAWQAKPPIPLQKRKWALCWVGIGKVVDVRKKRNENVGPFRIEGKCIASVWTMQL